MDFDYEAVFQVFLAESQENLDAIERALIALEASPQDEELLQSVFRGAHTIKGNASSLGLDVLTDFVHRVEDLLDHLRTKRLPVTAGLITLLLQAVDALRVLVSGAGRSEESLRPEHGVLMEQLARWPAGLQQVKTEAQDAAQRNQPDPTSSIGDRSQTLRIGIHKLDQIMNMMGEITIARSRLGQMLEHSSEWSWQAILETHQAADQLYAELQELITRIRMVPVGALFRQCVRMVRDLATPQGKSVRLLLQGEEVELDTRVIEQVRDPLTHLIRNAIGHGIELPEVRQSQGKDPCGQLLLRAFHDGGSVVLQLRDDGAGFQRDRILARARAFGWHIDEQVFSDQEMFKLAFQPGFSTAENVTEMSGRGVGMDVVQRNVGSLRGTVNIESSPGRGTTITLRLPLTLAIIDGFIVGVGTGTYVIPMHDVLECVELPKEQQDRSERWSMLSVRGALIPYLRLRPFFGVHGEALEREIVLIVQSNGKKVGVGVDALYGTTQAVIKPLGPLFQQLPGVGGSTILATGQVALILDIPSLVRETERQHRVVCGSEPRDLVTESKS